MRRLRELFLNLTTGLRRDLSRYANAASHNVHNLSGEVNLTVAKTMDADLAGRDAIRGETLEIPEYQKRLQRLGYPTSVETGLGGEVDEIAGLSEDLIRQIQDVQQFGWTIRYGKRGDGTYADYEEKAVVLDRNMEGNARASADALAHEIDHAHPGNPHNDAPSPPMGRTREQWVADHVDRSLRNEGHAVMSQLAIRRQILENGGPDINHSVSGKYRRIYERYRGGEFSHDEAVQRIADHYRFERGSHSNMSYGQNFRQWYEDYWDTWIAQTA
ncbi:hypothetical protein [Nocardia sp. NPDC047038]|uniref:hypothetical protein n=1 Tax=Nocardia sp. NPDC047038 TaxID=3154338 RepID=UPI0033D5D0C0